MNRSFGALVGAQFFGAFNDNLFKQLVLLLAAGTLFPGKDLQGLAFAVFSLPFVVFSGIAGDLSERFSKRRIIVLMKVVEIGIMLGGIFAFWGMSWPLMLFVLGIMGVQSAFFGPSKYGVIPELVGQERLVPANGMITMTTFLAVLIGQAVAGPLLDNFGPAAQTQRLWVPGVVCVGFAVLGTIIAVAIKPLPPQKPDLVLPKQPFGSLWSTIKTLRESKGLFRLVVLNSFIWFNSAVLNQAVNGMGAPGYLDVPADGKTELSYLLTMISVGIIIGSVLAPRLAKTIGLPRVVLIGGVGMVTFQMGLLTIGSLFFRDSGAFWVALVLLAIIGAFGALIVVSVQAYLQDAPPPGMRGQTFAVNNFMNFLFMFLAGGFYLLSNLFGPTIVQAVAGAFMLVYVLANRRYIAMMHIGDPQ